MMPLVWRIMNAIFSGVAAPAAMMRSPSFSRSVSSTTITSSPWRMAAMASLMVSSFIKSPKTALRRSSWRRTPPRSRPILLAILLEKAGKPVRLHSGLLGDPLGQHRSGGAQRTGRPVQPIGDGIEDSAPVDCDQAAGFHGSVRQGRARQRDAEPAGSRIQHKIVILEPAILRA